MAQTLTDTKTGTTRMFTTREVVFTVICAALLAVCSWISIPTAVPFPLQTFGVFCTLELLGGKKGFFSILVFLLLGAIGIPVFAEFSGGLGVILGATGGYLIGFLLTAVIYWLSEKSIPLHEKLWFRIIVLLIGLVMCYLFGTLWFIQVYTKNVEAISFRAALDLCVIEFVIPDLLKLTLAVILAGRIKNYVKF